MTHPYRLALSSATSPTCLDPPRACEPPPKKRPRMEILLAGCAVIAGVVGAATLHAVGHGGHVEIAPAALAHARAHTYAQAHARREPGTTRRPPPAPAAAKMPFLSGTHEPKELLSRAKELQALGLDVSLVDVRMAKPFTEWPDTRADFMPTSSVPLYGTAGHLDALELRGIPRDSSLRVAGIAEGDQLLGIDGYTLVGDTFRNVDPNVIRKRGSMVVEIARGDHHVLLSIHWPVR